MVAEGRVMFKLPVRSAHPWTTMGELPLPKRRVEVESRVNDPNLELSEIEREKDGKEPNLQRKGKTR